MPTINGTPGPDLLNGTGQGDIISGFQSNDTLNGLGFNDIILGNQDNDLIDGGPGKDTLFGGQGSDTLFGRTEADQISGDFGDDFISGGEGIDLILGGPGNDQISGGSFNDALFGGTGIDAINGNGGNDLIYGGQDSDYLVGSQGNDSLFGDLGNDTIEGGDGLESIRGGQGIDFIFGGNDTDTIFGDNEGDVITGDGGADSLLGGNGADFVAGGTENDTLLGDPGNDSLFGGQNEDRMEGGEGNDFLSGDRGNDTLQGNAGNDALAGDSNNTVAGNDFLFGGTGADILLGGAGRDTFAIDANSGSFQISGADIVTDFFVDQNGNKEDKIGLGGGLTFANLSITQGTGANANDVVIRQIASTGQAGQVLGDYLMVLQNVNVALINQTDFVTVDLPTPTPSPTPTPTPTPTPPPTPTPTPSNQRPTPPQLVGGEVLTVSNDSGIDATQPGTVIGQIRSSDNSGIQSYEISRVTGGASTTNFSISNNGNITLNSAPGGNGPFGLVVRSTNTGGRVSEEATINVYTTVGAASSDPILRNNRNDSFPASGNVSGQDTIIVAPGKYDEASLSVTQNTTLRFTIPPDPTGAGVARLTAPAVPTPITGSLVAGTTLSENFRGNSSSDLFFGGQGADTLNGVSGQDYYVYTALNEGGDVIQGFGNSSVILVNAQTFGAGLTAGQLSQGQLFLSNSVFNPASPPSAYQNAANGDQLRFIYDSQGNLFFDANGSAAGGIANNQPLAVLNAPGRPSVSNFSNTNIFVY